MAETHNAEPAQIPEFEPNIIFVGDGDPITRINNGMDTIVLPAVDVQQKITKVPSSKEGEPKVEKAVSVPFYHKQAGTIVQLFPDQYKRFVKKG